jgi:Uma2 family endonuclease
LVEKVWDAEEMELSLRIASAMHRALKDQNSGAVFGPRCPVPLREHLIRMPDVVFVRWDAADDTDIIEYPASEMLEVIPTLAVEILGNGNTAREMAIKLGEYAAFGVKLVWYVDPEAKTVTVYPKGRERGKKVLGEGDTLDGGKVLPGFALSVTDLFAPKAPKPTKKKGKR